MFNNHIFRISSADTINFYDLLRSGNYDKEKFKKDYIDFNSSRFKITEKMIEGLDFILTYPDVIDDIIELKNLMAKYNFKFYEIMKYHFNKLYYNPLQRHLDKERNELHRKNTNQDLYEAYNIIRDYENNLSLLNKIGEQDEMQIWGKFYTKQEIIEKLNVLKPKAELAEQFKENFKKNLKELEEVTILKKYGFPISEIEKSASECGEIIEKLLNIVGQSNLDMIQYLVKDIFFLKQLFFKESSKEKSPSLRKPTSKYFSEFNLNNSSNAEKELFINLEKLGLHAIPAEQKSSMSMMDENGDKFGFRIDFLLPCNVREYDGESYTLRQDIIFVGEYFGYYGEDYDARKVKKVQWQNNFEKSLDQRCLHIDKDSDLCSVLKEKNIDSKCYPDFNGHLFDIENADQKKLFYVKSQLQNFLYIYIVNELLWQIQYNYNLNTMENFNKVKEKNKSYIDRYNDLISDAKRYDANELAFACGKILSDYKRSFNKEKYNGKRSLRLSKTFNNRKNSSIL